MLTVRPLRPSPAYLAISQGLSRRDSSITARKLLILDLNGTILLRPKPRPTKNKTNSRPVHPRPYMPSFKSFLFHDAVKPWLDVRVWSSAQPHSVNAMVERCFGNQMLELQAVWARDTLGLSPEDYCTLMVPHCNMRQNDMLSLFVSIGITFDREKSTSNEGFE